MGVSAAVYGPDYDGPPTELADSFHRSWQDVTPPGTFSVQLENDDEDLADCDFGDVIRFSVDGEPAFPGIIESKKVVSIAQGEEHDQVTELAGRGTLALNDSFIVYPEILGGLVGDTRFFNFASTLYDDSAWTAALTDDITSGQGAPPNWPDLGIQKISCVYDPDTNAPPGFNWFRKTITIPSTDLYRLHFSADDAVSIFIDGVQVVSPTAIIGKTMAVADVFLSAGDHLFAAEVENYPGGMVNFIWFLFALNGLNQDGSLGTQIAGSDSSWAALGFVDPPGFTPGAVLLALRSEAVARGVAVPTFSFDAAVDSAGNPWTTSPDIAFSVGLKGLAVLAQMGQTYIDVAMALDELRLDAWVHGTRGAVAATELHAPTDPADPMTGNLSSLEHELSA